MKVAGGGYVAGGGAVVKLYAVSQTQIISS